MSANPTVVFTRPEEIAIENRSVPEPGPDEVLIKTTRTLISIGTELTILAGKFPPGSAWADYGRFPFVAGYSNVGRVTAVGADVDRSWIGRRVASNGPHARFVTASAGASASPARPIVHPEIGDDEATFFALAEIVMNGLRRGRIGWGESVVIYGMGLLGQLAARFCRLLGARPVIAVDVAPARLALLPEDPGLVRVNPRERSLAEVVEEATRGRRADAAVELTGNPALIPDEFASVRNQGRVIILSSPSGPTTLDLHDLCNARSISIIGAHASSHPALGELDLPWTRPRHTELFFDLIAGKEIDLQPLITRRAPYTDAPEMYRALLADRSQTLGVILEWPE
jgi:2-desacetyl-2-hydroxyethyl bacteriochlorophyllide A dehydrogenase